MALQESAATGMAARQFKRCNCTNNVPQECGEVNIRELRIEKGIPAADIVATVQELYSKFDKHLLSKAERPDQYGIRLCEPALIEIVAKHAPELAFNAKKKDVRRLPCRISERLSKSDYTELQQALRRHGYRTMQDWLSVMVRRYLNVERMCEGEAIR